MVQHFDSEQKKVAPKCFLGEVNSKNNELIHCVVGSMLATYAMLLFLILNFARVTTNKF